MATRGSRGTSSLFTPLKVIDVLIPDEVVQYNERRHWASLLRPFFETISILILITMFAGGLPAGAFGGFLFLLAVIVLVVVTARRSDSASASVWWQWSWSVRKLALTAVGLVVGLVIFGQEFFSIVLTIGAALRFVARVAMWAFYERLFITNRRVIASAGFLGAEINGMPLARTTDVEFKRTVLGELLNYGSLRIETAGQDQALGLITFLNEPDLFYNILIGLSTTALGSVKDPLSKEKMDESQAVTIRPGRERPVRLSFLRRRPGAPPVVTGNQFDDGT